MPNDVFNEKLRRKRLSRISPDSDALFLRHAMCDTVTERLGDMQRRFPLALASGFAGRRDNATLCRIFGAERTLVIDELPLCGDAHASPRALPFPNDTFDALIGIMPLHATNDVPGCLREYRRALKKDGLLLIAFVGETTLQEVRRDALKTEEALTQRVSMRFAPFIDVKSAGMLLASAGFDACVADVDSFTAEYSNFTAFIKDLRAMGENGLLAEKKPLPPRNWANAIDEKRRQDGHNALFAVYDVIYLTGVKS